MSEYEMRDWLLLFGGGCAADSDLGRGESERVWVWAWAWCWGANSGAMSWIWGVVGTAGWGWLDYECILKGCVYLACIHKAL